MVKNKPFHNSGNRRENGNWTKIVWICFTIALVEWKNLRNFLITWNVTTGY